MQLHLIMSMPVPFSRPQRPRSPLARWRKERATIACTPFTSTLAAPLRRADTRSVVLESADVIALLAPKLGEDRGPGAASKPVRAGVYHGKGIGQRANAASGLNAHLGANRGSH